MVSSSSKIIGQEFGVDQSETKDVTEEQERLGRLAARGGLSDVDLGRTVLYNLERIGEWVSGVRMSSIVICLASGVPCPPVNIGHHRHGSVSARLLDDE